jgi:hypothetical protein
MSSVANNAMQTSATTARRLSDISSRAAYGRPGSLPPTSGAGYKRLAQKALASEKARLSAELRDRLLASLRWRMRERYAEPELEHRFHPTRRWRIDLYWPAASVGVDIEGGTRARKGARRCRVCGLVPQGGHNTGTGYESNVEKYNEAKLAGILHLQATRASIEDGRAAEWIARALEARLGEAAA